MKKSRDSRYIGAFEAKTRLAELLRDAENGMTYVIRRRGKDVAQLIPPAPKLGPEAFERLKADCRALRKQIRGKIDAKALIREGRR